jgi:hypothetical protein
MICPNAECPDRIISGIPGEYRDGIEKCPKCGSDLVPDELLQALPSEPDTALEQPSRPLPVKLAQIITAGAALSALVVIARGFPDFIEGLRNARSVIAPQPLFPPIARFLLGVTVCFVLPISALLALHRRKPCGRWLGFLALAHLLYITITTPYSLMMYRVLLGGTWAYQPLPGYFPYSSTLEIWAAALLICFSHLGLAVLAGLLLFRPQVREYLEHQRPEA